MTRKLRVMFVEVAPYWNVNQNIFLLQRWNINVEVAPYWNVNIEFMTFDKVA